MKDCNQECRWAVTARVVEILIGSSSELLLQDFQNKCFGGGVWEVRCLDKM